jgi:hypothetical protein
MVLFSRSRLPLPTTPRENHLRPSRTALHSGYSEIIHSSRHLFNLRLFQFFLPREFWNNPGQTLGLSLVLRDYGALLSQDCVRAVIHFFTIFGTRTLNSTYEHNCAKARHMSSLQRSFAHYATELAHADRSVAITRDKFSCLDVDFDGHEGMT